MVSAQRALGDRLHGFEEASRWLALFGESDVNLEMRFRATQGQTPNDESLTDGFGQQRVGAFKCRGVSVIHGDVAGRGRPTDEPFLWHAREGFAAGPARGIERFELALRHLPQDTADNERVAAAADAAERPHPGHVARLEKGDQSHAAEWWLAIPDHHLNRARSEPAQGGALAEQGQAALHPVHQQAAPTDIPDRAGGKPGNQRDRDNSYQFRHGGGDNSTPTTGGWIQALREFIYGMTAYEFVQQAREMHHVMERLFFVGVFGDMLGVPILPSYYGLRLLPWVVPEIQHWKREMLRERTLGDEHEHHLHGL